VVAAKPKPRARAAAHAAGGGAAGSGNVEVPMQGTIVKVLVEVGQDVEVGQAVVVLEAMKMENQIAAEKAGKVKEIKVKAGDKVKVGQPILSVDDGRAAERAAPAKAAAEKPAPAKPAAESAPAAGANTAAKVPADEAGLEQHVEGPKRDVAADKPGVKQPGPAAPQQEVPVRAARTGGAPGGDKVVDINRGARQPAEPAAAELPPAPAAPSVRRMARELGVDINQVTGSGDGGRISVEDVKAHAKRLVSGALSGAGAAAAEPLPDFTRWGEVERQPMRPVRRKTAEHLASVWAHVPHVTQFDLADITSLEELRRKYAPQAESAGGNLTITAIAVKICAAALRKVPQCNESIDSGASEIVLKK
jgi:pyruvate dehydrogenase E2 component (dihydrolipoamide acetyltransferase)